MLEGLGGAVAVAVAAVALSPARAQVLPVPPPEGSPASPIVAPSPTAGASPTGTVVAASGSLRTVRISGEPNGTNFAHASLALLAPWKRQGGDYKDLNGVLNGPTPHASAEIGYQLQTVTFDISRIQGDVLLRFDGARPPKWSNPRIDGVPAEAFWVHSSSRNPIGDPPLQLPAFVFNPSGGKSLSIQIDNVYDTGTIAADEVEPPEIDSLPMVRGGLAANVGRDADLARRAELVRYLELRDEATLRTLLPRGTVAEPFAYQPEWLSGPKGLPALRFSSDPTNRRLIAWLLRFNPREEAYARYCLFIEDDVADGMDELGIKLPGLAGDEFSWRMEHGRIAPGNRGLYAALDYLYAAELGRGYPKFRSMGGTLQAGRWYSVEQYVKLNTPGKADGVGKVWINGTLTWESHEVRYRDKPTSRINRVHVNVYHGGRRYVKAPIHYRIAAIAVATSYIGPPPELFGDPATPPSPPKPASR